MEFNTRQQKVINATDNKILCLAAAGSGKALPNSTIIPTLNGFKRVDEVQVGDYLFDRTGKPTKVTEVFPQGPKEVFEVTFEDGRVARCCSEHIWNVNNTTWEYRKFKNLTLEQILYTDWQTFPYAIPIAECIEYEGEVENCRDMGVSFFQDANFSIPMELRISKPEFRFEFIQVIMDNCATLEHDTMFHDFEVIVNIPIDLYKKAAELIEIVRSLGYICKSSVIGNLVNIRIISTNEKLIKLFKYNQEAIAQLQPYLDAPGDQFVDRVDIINIQSLHYQEDMTCFMVDNEEHLFLTNDYIVTHNTATLTQRVKEILDSGCNPKDVICITFTNMAAEEMKKRLGDCCHGAYIGTIHGLANNVCIKGGYDTSEWISGGHFDKLLEKAVLLNSKHFPSVKYLFIDEFQDTGELEMKFINRIKAKNFFAVADDRQSIYGFKGADLNILRGIYEDYDTTVYQLNQNYRCPPNILSFAEDFLGSMQKMSISSSPVKSKNGILEKCSFYEAVEEMEYYGDWGSWAIITRSNDEIVAAQETLNAKNIPNITFKKGDLDLIEMEKVLTENKVKILTAHVGKGLSFKKVIGVGAKLFKEEERRIAYVMATRAEQELYWCPSIKPKNKKKSTNAKIRGIAKNTSKSLIEF